MKRRVLSSIFPFCVAFLGGCFSLEGGQSIQITKDQLTIREFFTLGGPEYGYNAFRANVILE